MKEITDQNLKLWIKAKVHASNHHILENQTNKFPSGLTRFEKPITTRKFPCYCA